jgi:hypothetical protein
MVGPTMVRALRRIAVLALTSIAVTSIVGVAHADDDDRREARSNEVLDADGPPSIPGLSHRDWAFDFEYMVAGAEATDIVSYQPIESGNAYAYAAHWLVEAPLSQRIWYAGATGGIGAASVPSGTTPGSGGSTQVLANPEAWIRGLWSSQVGLGAGGGLGVVIPVPREYNTLEAEVVRVIRVVRPADFQRFRDMGLSGKPFFDIRYVAGPVSLQMRQGVEASVLLRERDDDENRYDLTAFASAYLGVAPFEQLVLGLELAEVYQLTADVETPQCVAPCDQNRVAITISPSLRVRLPPLSPALSFIIPLSTPLRGEVDSYVAGRLHLEVLF